MEAKLKEDLEGAERELRGLEHLIERKLAAKRALEEKVAEYDLVIEELAVERGELYGVIEDILKDIEDEKIFLIRCEAAGGKKINN